MPHTDIDPSLAPSVNAAVTRVVVGTDWSDTAERAVDWATDYAEKHHAPLSVMHVTALPLHPAVGMHPLSATHLEPWVQATHVDGAEQRLNELAESIAAKHPELSVDAITRAGAAAHELLHEARDFSHVLVVGARGSNGLLDHLLGSTSDQVVTRGIGPVIVVPQEAGAVDGMVRVGVDGQASEAALRFAAQEAIRRDVTLDIVTAADTWGDAEAAERLNQATAVVSQEYPHARYESRIGVGEADEVLLTGLQPDSLLVVGSRGRGRLQGALLGSTSRTLCSDAAVPVAVVRSDD